MNKLDKERYIINIRLEEIKSINRDVTNQWFKVLAALLLTFVFIYTNKIIVDIFLLIPLIIIAVFIILWIAMQTEKYIQDCYDLLIIYIKNNKILEFEIPYIKWYQAIFYRKKNLK